MIPMHALRKDAAEISADAVATTSPHNHNNHQHKFAITDATIEIPSSARRRIDEPPASRWRTPEFYVYYAIFVVVVPMIVWVPMRLSLRE
jgi:hypothetical protein